MDCNTLHGPSKSLPAHSCWRAARRSSVIIATGASPRILGLEGEQELYGKAGVTTDATCDGAHFSLNFSCFWQIRMSPVGLIKIKTSCDLSILRFDYLSLFDYPQAYTQ